MNSKLDKLIGSFYSINDTFIVPSNSKSKNKDPVKVELNEMNSFFADVEKVQATMMQLYGITPQGMCSYSCIAIFNCLLYWQFADTLQRHMFHE